MHGAPVSRPDRPNSLRSLQALQASNGRRLTACSPPPTPLTPPQRAELQQPAPAAGSVVEEERKAMVWYGPDRTVSRRIWASSS